MKKKIAIGVGVVVLALGVIGAVSGGSKPVTVTSSGDAGATSRPSNAAQTAAATPMPKVGDKVAAGNWEYTVTKVERVPELVWSSFGNKEPAKGVWVVLSLTLKNIGTRNFGIAGQDFELRDEAQVKYDTCSSFACSSFLTQNKLSRISSTEQFPPGVEVKTALMFDVNPQTKGLRLVLKQANNTPILLD